MRKKGNALTGWTKDLFKAHHVRMTRWDSRWRDCLAIPLLFFLILSCYYCIFGAKDGQQRKQIEKQDKDAIEEVFTFPGSAFNDWVIITIKRPQMGGNRLHGCIPTNRHGAGQADTELENQGKPSDDTRMGNSSG